MRINPVVAALVLSKAAAETATSATIAAGDLELLKTLDLQARFATPEAGNVTVDYNNGDMVATSGETDRDAHDTADTTATEPTHHESKHQHKKSERQKAKTAKKQKDMSVEHEEKEEKEAGSKASKAHSVSMSHPAKKGGKSSKGSKGAKGHSASMSHPIGKASKADASMSHPAGKAVKQMSHPDPKATKNEGKAGKRGKRSHSMNYAGKAEKTTGTASTLPAADVEPTEPVDIVVFTEAPDAADGQPIVRSGTDTKDLTGKKMELELGKAFGSDTAHHHGKKENVGALDMEESRLNGATASDENSGVRYGMVVGGACLVLSAVGFAFAAY